MLDPLSFSIPQYASLSQPSAPPLPVRKLLQPVPDSPDEYLLELDYSHGIGSFAVCQRQWRNQNIFSREAARDASATSFGKLFHSCEELRLRYGWSDAVKTKQHELVAQHFLHHPPALGDHRTADRMIDILKKYNDLYAGDSWPKNVLTVNDEVMVERPFKIPLCSIEVNGTLPYPASNYIFWKEGDTPWEPDETEHGLGVAKLHIILTGRIDAILSDSNLNFVVDHKTSSRGGREFEEAFYLSLQTRGYCWAARALGIPVSGLIMNALVIRPPTKTGTATEFNRHTYFYSDDSLDEWEENVRAHVTNMVHALTTGFFPQTALSFKSPCSGCDFQDNCRLPRHQRAADLASDLYRDVTWSPINE